MKSSVWESVRALALFSVLFGMIYPLCITGAAQALFPRAANGSLVERDGKVVGSELIGREWTSPRSFLGRPSATATPYDASASSGSNLGPLNPTLADNVAKRAAFVRTDDPRADDPVPVDLVTSSGSGLDPHISPAAAYRQVERVAALRKLPPDTVRALVAARIERPDLGVLGEPRVNVLLLNLDLEALH